MTRSSPDIVQRLRHLAKLLGVGNFDIPSVLNEAADEIDRLSGFAQAVPDGVREALAQRLRDAAQTAQNDDLSKPQTEKRERHSIRIEAILDAAEYLEELGTGTVPQAPPSDDELAELIDGHLALDRLSVPRQSEDFDLTIARRINLLVHDMEQAAKPKPQERET